MADKKEQEEKKSESENENSFKSKMLEIFSKQNVKILIIMIASLLLVFFILFSVIGSKTDKESFGRIKINPEKPYSFGQMVIALYSEGVDVKDISGHIEIEVAIKIADYQLEKLLNQKTAVLRNVIINTIEKRTINDLYSLNNKKRERKMISLKRSLTKVIAKELPKGEIFEVFFAKYFIQKAPQKKQKKAEIPDFGSDSDNDLI